MAEFNWNEQPKANDQSFDWGSQPVAKIEEPRLQKMIESSARLARQGQTMGLSDEATAAIQSVGDELDPIISKLGITNPTVVAAIKTAVSGAQVNPFTGPMVGAIRGLTNKINTGEFLSPEYKKERDIERGLDAGAAQELGPGLSTVAQIAGSATNPLNYIDMGGAPLMQGGGYLKGIGNAIIQGARQAAPIGAAYGFGGSSASDLPAIASDTAQGALGGGVTGGVAGGLSNAVFEAPGALKNFANKRAVESIDLPKNVRTKLGEGYQKPDGSFVTGKQNLLDLGGDLLDEGVISVNNSPEAIQMRNRDLLKRGWNNMKEPLEESEKNAIYNFDPMKIWQKVKSQFSNLNDEEEAVLKNLGGLEDKTPVEKLMIQDLLNRNYPNRTVFKDVENTLMSQGNSPITAAKGHALREAIDDKINFNKVADPKLKDKIRMFTRKAISDELNQSVSDVAERIGKPDLAKKFIEGNEQYSLGKTVQEPVATMTGEEFSTAKPQGLLGYAEKPIDWAAKAIGKTVGNPGIANNLSKMLQATPQVFGKFAPVLQDAAQRGAAALSSANHVLTQQSEEYRNKMRELNGQPLDQ